MQMPARALAAAAVLITSVAFVSCGDDGADDDGATPTAPAATSTTAPPTVEATPDAEPTGETPASGVTGIAAVDDALAAATAGDAEALTAQLEYTQVGCVVEQQGLPSMPECEPGTPDGTLVETFTTAQCEGAFIAPEEAPAAVARFLQSDLALYAVYETPATYFPEGARYAIVLEATGGEPQWTAREIVIGEEGVVALNYCCGETPDVLASNRGLTDPIARGAE
jgi:hypothetical protein